MEVFIRKNTVQLFDQYLASFNNPSYDDTFYDFKQEIRSSQVRRIGSYEGRLLHLELLLTKDQLAYTRTIYNGISLISDLGGVFELFVFSFIPIMIGITDYSFKLSFIKTFYKFKKGSQIIDLNNQNLTKFSHLKLFCLVFPCSCLQRYFLKKKSNMNIANPN